MATQQVLDTFMSPRNTADKRSRETTPPSQKTNQSPDTKSYRPNNTTPADEDNSEEDKKRKARGRQTTSDTSGMTPMETEEANTSPSPHTETAEREIVKIKKKKKKKKKKKQQSKEKTSKSRKEPSTSTKEAVGMTEEVKSKEGDQDTKERTPIGKKKEDERREDTPVEAGVTTGPKQTEVITQKEGVETPVHQETVASPQKEAVDTTVPQETQVPPQQDTGNKTSDSTPTCKDKADNPPPETTYADKVRENPTPILPV